MLVFARKKGQEIIFPDLGITIQVLGAKSAGNISIGIDAPLNIRCHRKEINDKIEAGAEDLTPLASAPPAATGPAQPVQLWAGRSGQSGRTDRPKRKDAPQS